MELQWMFITQGLGFFETILLFYGTRILIRIFSKVKEGKLHVFNFRQIEENVILQSTTLAINSLLILAALCCFDTGIGIVSTNVQNNTPTMDYTFDNYGEIPPEETITTIQTVLTKFDLEKEFPLYFSCVLDNFLPQEHMNLPFRWILS